MAYPTEVNAVVVAPAGNLGTTSPTHRQLHDQYRTALLSIAAKIDADAVVSISAQTGSYTLVLADAAKAVEMNVAGANNLTVPPNSVVAFQIGTVIEIAQVGAGTTTLVPGAGVTLQSRGALLRTAGQYAVASIRKRATDTWIVAGDLIA